MDYHHCSAHVTERIVWLARHARITRRLWAWVVALTQLLQIAHVARLTGPHWHTIKEIGWLRLQAQYGQFEGRIVRSLIMDEFPMNTNILEGVNYRIKVIKRTAYGFRDSAYFFLTIKMPSPERRDEQ